MKKLLATIVLALGLSAALPTAPAQAQSEPFLGEISWFAGNFAPRGWAFCDGQILQISQYSALFSLLGTTYGGDGRVTFALPDMRGRVPMHPGNGPGLTPRTLGQRLGQETHVQSGLEVGSHSHTATLHATESTGNSPTPTGNVLAGGTNIFHSRSSAEPSMDSSSIQVANGGGGQPFNIMQPSLGVNCIIALQGIFPSRS